MRALELVTVEDARAAANRLQGLAIRTPLVRLPLVVDDTPAEIYLKLENLQPIASFKIRPAGNAILALSEETREKGVYTASSGNMAQGVAYVARELGIPCTVLLTRNASANKVAALKRLDARLETLDDDAWWRVLDDGGHPDEPGHFIHPVADQDVLAGDATVGLEIMGDLPDVDSVLVPYGGGGLAVGIASVVHALRPEARIVGVEPDYCAPLAAAREAGHPVELPFVDTFVIGIGVGRVVDEMWPLVRRVVDDAVSVSLDEIASAIRLLCERQRIVAEGASAAPVAAALSGRGGSGKIVCVVSGGNLNTADLVTILRGGVPTASP